MVPAERFELPTYGLQDRCTTVVLYGRNWLPDRARTCDRALNRRLLYQLSY